MRSSNNRFSSANYRGATISCPSLSSTPHAPRITKSCNSELRIAHPAHLVEIAWESSQPSVNVHFIQPFRRKRRRRRGLPKCVPSLDLSQFNLPDELMDPIQATCECSHLVHCCGQKSACSVSELKCDAVLSKSSGGVTTSQGVHQSSHLKEVVESKIISHERAKSAACFAVDSKDLLGLESHGELLSKKLRFEARIATQNGRDIHRELCGFYFLADGSITLYEFRQFGKKINALPLIQRGVYHHCLGCRKGKPYEISHITKGATLQFRTKSHPGLSENLALRTLLTVKVSFVDEQIKRQLLCEGRNQIQCQQVDQYLSSPLALIGLEEDKMLRTLQSMFRSRLQGRACKALVGLGRHLALHALDGVVSFIHLQISLRKFHISLTAEDMQQFWQLLSKSDVFSEDCGGIQLDFCLQALTGGFSEDRIGLIRQVFMRLDSSKTGHIDIHQMKKFFIHAVTEYTSVWSEMFNIFNLEGNHNNIMVISYPDFENFHLGVSTETASDSKFCSLMRTYWQI